MNNIKPSYLLDQSYRYYSSYPKKLPEGRPYETVECDHPSWIEEQRVHRSLWHLEVYFDLVTITEPTLGNASQVWDLLKHEGPHRAWPELMKWEIDEMDCVYELLQEILEETRSSSARPAHLTNITLLEQKHVTAPLSIPIDHDSLYDWCQATVYLNKETSAVNSFYSVGSSPFSPLSKTSFRPFRRLGFGIWDLEKMARLGLTHLSMRLQPPRVSEMYWVGPFKRSPRTDDFLIQVAESFN